MDTGCRRYLTMTAHATCHTQTNGTGIKMGSGNVWIIMNHHNTNLSMTAITCRVLTAINAEQFKY